MISFSPIIQVPDNHDPHEGECPKEEEQVCKSTGVFLNSKKYQVSHSSLPQMFFFIAGIAKIVLGFDISARRACNL